MRVIRSRLVFVLVYMGLVFALSSIPGRHVGRLGLSISLVSALHLPLFAGLSWVTLSSLRGPRALRWVVVAAVCMVYALSDEWHQSFVPGRYFSIGDMVLDAAGVALGLVVGEWFASRLGPDRGVVDG